jgi:hypothetical protein
MGLVTNVTDRAAAHVVGRNRDGRMVFTCVVKAAYTWQADGTLSSVPADPVRAQDQLVADPDVPDAVPPAPALVHPAELGPRKVRVDVVLVGALAARAPVDSVDAVLAVGSRLRKTVRIVGDRAWLPTARGDLQASRAKPFARMPIAWERSFGGVDPEDPSQAEMRNPVGVGLCGQPKAMAGMRLPNFEDPRDPITSPKSRPGPVGFGAVASHWLPRSRLAGTYDKSWNERRRPLLPEDFDPAFYNVAPDDQQLDGFVPGEEVRLINLTMSGHDRFALPDASVPIIFVTDKAIINTRTAVDTILIDPEKQQLSLISRAEHLAEPSLLTLRNVIVGEPSRGLRRAITTGKRFIGRGNREKDPQRVL